MALTFPTAIANLADLLPIESVAWNIYRQDEYSGLGTGEGLAHDLGPQLWEAEITTAERYHDTTRQLRARLNALDGSNQAFYLYDPASQDPQSDPGGLVVAAQGWVLASGFWNDDGIWVDGLAWGATTFTVVIATINVNRKALTLSGLPPNFVGTPGDLFHVDYGATTRRALLEVVEAFTANSSGVTPEFEVRPHLRPGIIVGNPVTFHKPAAKMKLVPGTLRLETVGALTSQLRFVARQTLQAG